MKKIIVLLCISSILLASCADSKTLNINGKDKVIEPYGWFDTSAKNDSVNYKINTGNVVLSIVFSETIIVPILLTGTEIYEPVSKK